MNSKTLRNIFLVVFIASSVMIVLFSRSAMGGSQVSPSPTDEPSFLPTSEPSDNPETNPQPVEQASASLAVFSSIAASATSLIGFLVTTIITWRKDQRESALADVERKKLETELAKSQLELEQLKKSGKKKIKK